MQKVCTTPYCTVFRDQNRAIKVIDRDFSIPPHSVEREVRLVRLLSHHNVIEFEDIENKFDDTYIYMKWYNYNLQEYVEAKSGKRSIFVDGKVIFGRKNKLEEADQILDQVLSAVQYIHKSGIIHRDIKPSNFLLNNAGHVVLTDFSVSIPAVENDNISDVCSTYYKSLELIFGLPYSYEIDIWALGVMILWLYSSDCRPALKKDDEEVSDFRLIAAIFDVFGTPSLQDTDENYWPEIFKVDSFQLVNLKPKKRSAGLFPRADARKRALFNKVCSLNQQTRPSIEAIVSEWLQRE